MKVGTLILKQNGWYLQMGFARAKAEKKIPSIL